MYIMLRYKLYLVTLDHMFPNITYDSMKMHFKYLVHIINTINDEEIKDILLRYLDNYMVKWYNDNSLADNTMLFLIEEYYRLIFNEQVPYSHGLDLDEIPYSFDLDPYDDI